MVRTGQERFSTGAVSGLIGRKMRGTGFEYNAFIKLYERFWMGGVRIINLYSLVCDSKPKVSRII